MTDVSNNNDELGSEVPAWKLRRQQRVNDNIYLGSTAFRTLRTSNDEFGGSRLSADIDRRRSNNDELSGIMATSTNGGARIPAWKLREQMKKRDHSFDGSDRTHSSSTGLSSMASLQSNNSSFSSHPSRSIRPVSRVPGGVDPSIPPAFRAAFQKQQDRKKMGDDFLSLTSVHSRSTGISRSNSHGSGCSRSNSYGSDSFGSLDDDDSDEESFDGEDSFASLDSDADEDDEAYRESRNQMARLEIEKQKQEQDAKRAGIRRSGGASESRFKKKSTGVHGTPLDFIAE